RLRHAGRRWRRRDPHRRATIHTRSSPSPRACGPGPTLRSQPVVSRLGRFRAAARELAERGRDLPAARRLRFALTIEALERFADGRSLNVLDAGCGEGLLAESVARRHPDWTVVAADVDDDQLERGRRRAEQAGLSNLRFVHRDLTGDLGDQAYDAVLAIECLVEIPDDDAALVSMARALSPG